MAPSTCRKSAVPIGPRPVLWHVMRCHAQCRHKDFFRYLGYGGRHILDYHEGVSNGSVLSRGRIVLLGRQTTVSGTLPTL
jgi:glucose-1-phosphate cytidylyltransferase